MNEFDLQIRLDRCGEIIGRLHEEADGYRDRIRELEVEVVGLRVTNDDLAGRTVNGITPEPWPPNRRTPEDSNAKAVALMRQHIASYSSIDAHRHNCLDLCRRIEDAEAKLKAIRKTSAWLVGEVAECWDRGRISIDAKTAADRLQAELVS